MRLQIQNQKSKIKNARSGFTLIELLIVIFIIIILMGLLMAGIQKVRGYMDEVGTGTEIDQMDQATEEFRRIMGDYPPGRIRLIEQPTAAIYYDSGNAFDMSSVDYLRRVFKGIYITVDPPGGMNPAHTHDWNGDFTAVAGADATLEGDECLVFFLGGIPQIDATGLIGGTGFCTDKTNPTLATPTRSRTGPFFEFKNERLVLSTNATGTAPRRPNNRFAFYRDKMAGVPYAYFQARYGSTNNYPCAALPLPVINDCPTLTGAFMPYWKSSAATGPTTFYTFHRADKFQIISAGRDATFGAGQQFDPTNPEQSMPNRVDRDNFTNFHRGQLAPR